MSKLFPPLYVYFMFAKFLYIIYLPPSAYKPSGKIVLNKVKLNLYFRPVAILKISLT